MSCVVFVPVLSPAALDWIGPQTALQRCLEALDAVRGIDRVCVALKTGIEAGDRDRVARIAAASSLPGLTVVDLPAIPGAPLPAAEEAVAAIRGLDPAEDVIAVRYPTTPFLAAATVETCLGEVAGPGHECRTALEQRVLTVADCGSATKPGLVAVDGVWAWARSPGNKFRGRAVAVGAIEAIDIARPDGWRLAQALADSGAV